MSRAPVAAPTLVACPVCGREFAPTVTGRVPEHGETSAAGAQLACVGGVVPVSLPRPALHESLRGTIETMVPGILAHLDAAADPWAALLLELAGALRALDSTERHLEILMAEAELHGLDPHPEIYAHPDRVDPWLTSRAAPPGAPA